MPDIIDSIRQRLYNGLICKVKTYNLDQKVYEVSILWNSWEKI